MEERRPVNGMELTETGDASTPEPQNARKRAGSESPSGSAVLPKSRARRGKGGMGIASSADAEDGTGEFHAMRADAHRVEVGKFDIFDQTVLQEGITALTALVHGLERGDYHSEASIFRVMLIQQITRFVDSLKWFDQNHAIMATIPRIALLKSTSGPIPPVQQPTVAETQPVRPGSAMVDASTQIRAPVFAIGAAEECLAGLHALEDQEKRYTDALLALHVPGHIPAQKDLVEASNHLSMAQTAHKTAKVMVMALAGSSWGELEGR